MRSGAWNLGESFRKACHCRLWRVRLGIENGVVVLYLLVFKSLFTLGALRFGCHKDMLEISCANAEHGSGSVCVTIVQYAL